MNTIIENVDNVVVSDTIRCHAHNYHTLNINKDKYLTIIQQNIRSISRNFDDFLILIEQIKTMCDIIILTECWLSRNTVIPNISGYTHYKSTKLFNQNDGIVIFYKNELNIIIIEPTFEESNCIIIKHPDIAVVSIYRPPCFYNTDLFIRSLNNVLLSLSTYKNITVMGDININIIDNSSDTRAPEYLNLNAFHGLLPAHNMTTRMDACLDHVMLRSVVPATTIVFNSTVTDHQAVMLCLQTVIIKNRINKTQKKINYENIKLELENTNFDFIFECMDTNDAAEKFVLFLQQLINSNTKEYMIPSRKRTVKPWITPGILKCIQNRDILYKKYKSSPNNEILKLTYTRYRNFCKSLINKAKTKYNKEQIDKAGKDSKKLWDVVKEITNTKKTNIPSTDLLNLSEKPKDSVNVVNNYFTGVGAHLAEAISKNNQTINAKTLKPMSDCVASFVMLMTDEKEVERLIMSLKTKCANGWDNISNQFIKEFKKFIIPPLTHICNLCLSNGVFPKVFKHSIIHPIFKSGDRDCISNYRPIAILPAFSKIIEKVINKRLMNYLESKNLLSVKQFGFRNGKSTDGAVHELTDLVVKNLDKSNKVIGIFIDLKKAFDTVSVPILISKLEACGIRGNQLALFEDYLSDRTQSTKVGEYISERAPITYGVPQGSILGPTLFLVYINDLASLQLTNGHIICYADDTCLLFFANTWEAVQDAAQNGFDLMNTWLKSNLLTLNLDKTKCISFSMRNIPREQSLIKPLIAHNCTGNRRSSSCSCQTIESVTSINYLGVVIDNNLSFIKHIDVLSSRLRKLIYIFKNLRLVMDQKSLKLIYLALGQTLLSYCITSWGGAPKTNIKKIEISQRAILKVSAFFPIHYSTELLYQHWQVLTVRQIFVLHTILKQHAMTTYSYYNVKPGVEARRVKNVCVPFKTKKIFTRKYFCYLGSYLYNKVNKILFINSCNKQDCKVKVQNWLFSQNYDKTEMLLTSNT